MNLSLPSLFPATGLLPADLPASPPLPVNPAADNLTFAGFLSGLCAQTPDPAGADTGEAAPVLPDVRPTLPVAAMRTGAHSATDAVDEPAPDQADIADIVHARPQPARSTRIDPSDTPWPPDGLSGLLLAPAASAPSTSADTATPLPEPAAPAAMPVPPPESTTPAVMPAPPPESAAPAPMSVAVTPDAPAPAPETTQDGFPFQTAISAGRPQLPAGTTSGEAVSETVSETAPAGTARHSAAAAPFPPPGNTAAASATDPAIPADILQPEPDAPAAISAAAPAVRADLPAPDAATASSGSLSVSAPAPAPAAPAVTATPTSAPPAAPPPAANPYADDFPDTIATHMHWLAGQGIGHARIHITPRELGSLEVHLTLNGDQLQAGFSAAHPEVRQALEHSLPHLRQLLDQHGLHLTHADVSQHRQHPTTVTADEGESGDETAADADTVPASIGESIPARPQRQSARHLLDAWV